LDSQTIAVIKELRERQLRALEKRLGVQKGRTIAHIVGFPLGWRWLLRGVNSIGRGKNELCGQHKGLYWYQTFLT
jgi:hypothetical protein